MTSNMFQLRPAQREQQVYQFICGPMRTTIRANDSFDAAVTANRVFDGGRRAGEWVQTGDNEFAWYES